MLELIRDLLLAGVRTLHCRARGHRFDKQTPSPAGTVYCSRCRRRFPAFGRSAA